MINLEVLDPMPLELRQRVARLLVQMSKLSEAPASKMGKADGKPESRPPSGSLADPRTRKPDPDVWLKEWYVWRLLRARDERDVLAATVEGEIRLAKRLHKAPADLTAGSLWKSSDSDERDKRIATEYEGLSPLEVATIESHRGGYCSEANVRLVRLKAGREPDDGKPSLWVKAPFDLRRSHAISLSKEGYSRREVARIVKVSASTVQRWLDAA